MLFNPLGLKGTMKILHGHFPISHKWRDLKGESGRGEEKKTRRRGGEEEMRRGGKIERE